MAKIVDDSQDVSIAIHVRCVQHDYIKRDLAKWSLLD
jgi:hypothetical protein